MKLPLSILLLCVLSSVLIGHAAGQTTQPATMPLSTEIDQEIERWIDGLSHDSWTERQQAEEKLIELGDAAIPRVQRLLAENDDPNLLASAENILVQIERLRLEGPTRVTLHFDDASSQEVLDAIAEQIGEALPVWPDDLWERMARAPVTVHLDRQPLWLALREICLQSNLRIQNMGAGRKLTLVQGGDDQMRGPFHLSGPFMVVAASTFESRSIPLARPNQPNRSRGMQFVVYAEPKLSILARSWQPIIEEMVGADGTVYPQPARHDDNLNSGGRGDGMWHARLTFPSDPNLTKVARLKGYLRAILLVRSQTGEVDLTNDPTGQTLEVDGHRLIIKELTNESPAMARLKITVSARPSGRQGYDVLSQANTLIESIAVLDAIGEPLGRAGSSGRGTDREYEYELRLSRQVAGKELGQPAKLVWTVPIEAREVKIPFEFTDIPLP